MSFVTVGVAAADLVSTGIKAGSDSVTDCGKECRILCKQKTKAFFNSRKDCKRICKSNCVQRLTPEELTIEEKHAERERKEITNMYVIGGLILAIALSVTLYVVLRKK